MQRLPIAVASPGVHRPVIRGFEHGQEGVVELDEVAAPAAVVDADRRTRDQADRVVGDVYPFAGRKVNTGRLLADDAQTIHQVVADRAFAGIVRRLRSRFEIGQFVERYVIRSMHAQLADGVVVSDRQHAAVADVGEQRIGDFDLPVVVGKQHRVSAQVHEPTIDDRAIGRAVESHGRTPSDRPVAAETRLVRFQHRAGGVCEGDSAKMHIVDRIFGGSFENDQFLQHASDKFGVRHVFVFVRQVVEDVIRRVEVPFAGRVQFLEHVFDEIGRSAADPVRPRRLPKSTDLPAAFAQRDRPAVVVDFLQSPLEVAPTATLEDVQHGGFGMGPTAGREFLRIK